MYHGRGIATNNSHRKDSRQSPRGYSPRHVGGLSPSPRQSAMHRSTPSSQTRSVSSSTSGFARGGSPAMRSAERLHKVGTISSTIARSMRTDLAQSEGAYRLDGNASARALNSFAWQLRRPNGPPPTPTTESLTAQTAYGEAGGSLDRSPPRSSSPTRSQSPSSLSLAKSPLLSHGSREAPRSDVAFGSARVQRPDSSTLATAFDAEALRLANDPQISGIF
jgi:hypothetical protein